MAHVSTDRTISGHALPGMSGFTAAIESLAARYTRYRLYRRTLAELSELSSRERADLGLSGQSPRAAAYEAVYGSRR